MQVVVVIPSTCQGMGELLSQKQDHQKSENRQYLLQILSNVQFLGLAFGGDTNEVDYIFMQLLKLQRFCFRSIGFKKSTKYTILKVMDLKILLN